MAKIDTSWMLEAGERALHVGAIVLGAILINSVAAHLIEASLEQQAMGDGVTRKGETLAMVAKQAISWFVFLVAALLVLERVYINPKTLLAVTGIGTLVVGIGARSIIRDFFASLLIVGETQYYHGEYAIIHGPVINLPLEGIIENITLRITEMRQRDGSLLFIPNGNITAIANQSRGAHRARVDIDIPKERATKPLLDALAQYADAARGTLTNVDSLSALGVTRIYHDRVVYSFVAYTQPDNKTDVQSAIHRGAWEVISQQQ